MSMFRGIGPWVRLHKGKWARFDESDIHHQRAVAVVKETVALRGRFMVLRPAGDYRDYSETGAMARADELLAEEHYGEQRTMG